MPVKLETDYNIFGFYYMESFVSIWYSSFGFW